MLRGDLKRAGGGNFTWFPSYASRLQILNIPVIQRALFVAVISKSLSISDLVMIHKINFLSEIFQALSPGHS